MRKYLQLPSALLAAGRFELLLRHLLMAGIATIGIGGCASSGETSRNVDPLEPINRPIYQFNAILDKFVLRPVAKGYDFITPDPLRTGISNFLGNLSYPIVIVNSFLQGELRQGASDTGRFLVNSTLGIAGLFDPATPLGMEAHQEDFGLTLAKWGVPEGPYIVVPIMGPRTFRSGTGTLADIQIDPMVQLNNTSVRDKILILWTIDSRANLLPVDEQLQNAFDPYLFLRDAYLQNRKFLRGESGSKAADPFGDDLDDDF